MKKILSLALLLFTFLGFFLTGCNTNDAYFNENANYNKIDIKVKNLSEKIYNIEDSYLKKHNITINLVIKNNLNKVFLISNSDFSIRAYDNDQKYLINKIEDEYNNKNYIKLNPGISANFKISASIPYSYKSTKLVLIVDWGNLLSRPFQYNLFNKDGSLLKDDYNYEYMDNFINYNGIEFCATSLLQKKATTSLEKNILIVNSRIINLKNENIIINNNDIKLYDSTNQQKEIPCDIKFYSDLLTSITLSPNEEYYLNIYCLLDDPQSINTERFSLKLKLNNSKTPLTYNLHEIYKDSVISGEIFY